MDAYRIPPIKEETMSKSYVMFKTIKNAISYIWRWWDWNQFILFALATVFIFLLIIGFYFTYGMFFLPNTIKGCYITSSDQIYSNRDDKYVYQNIDWMKDPIITTCKDLDCLSKIFASDFCKP